MPSESSWALVATGRQGLGHSSSGTGQSFPSGKVQAEVSMFFLFGLGGVNDGRALTMSPHWARNGRLLPEPWRAITLLQDASECTKKFDISQCIFEVLQRENLT